MSFEGIAPSAAQDVVGVFDEGFNQLFVTARPVRALVRQGSKLMEHPVESGATIADHRVRLPIEIDLQFILDPEEYQDTFQQIKNVFEAAKTLSVQTKADTYDNMVMLEMPHDESADMADTVAVAVKLRGVIFVAAQYAELPPAEVKTKSNSSTKKTGQKQAKTPTPKKSSAAFDLIYGSKP